MPNEAWIKIQKAHNSVCGHGGVERTLKKLTDASMTWPSMREHVRKFTSRCKDYMVKNLRPFVMTEQTTGRPIDIAVKDREDIFVVRDIIDMSGNPSHKKNLLFKVLWEGYPDDEFTWEPWANVRSNVYLIKFLSNHPSKKIQALEPKNTQLQPNA